MAWCSWGWMRSALQAQAARQLLSMQRACPQARCVGGQGRLIWLLWISTTACQWALKPGCHMFQWGGRGIYVPLDPD